MTKKVDLLIGEPCPELLCGICSDVLEDPLQVHCPEDHMFCKNCIESHIKQQPTCPLCMTNLDSKSFQLSKFAQRQISRLRIKCLYADNGCTWTGLFSDNHQSECKFKPIRCPNADKGCTEINLTEFNKDEHIKNCLYQLITCPNQMPLCQPFLLKDLAKHENECQSYACPYSNEGCTFIGTQTQANMHCEQYCGRLHKRIHTLEEEVKRLNKLIQDFTVGFSLNLPQTPDTTSKERSTTIVNQEDDTTMAEINLLSQMFNADPFGPLTSSPTATISNTTTNNNMTVSDTNDNTMADINTPMMDITTCLTDMGFLDSSGSTSNTTLQLAPTATTNNTNTNANTMNSNSTATMLTNRNVPAITTAGTTTPLALPNMPAPSPAVSTKDSDITLEDAASPPALEFVPPLNAPKRASNGKRIRYSKNVKLAHNALRIARQRTTATGTHNNDAIQNPSNDAILNNLNIAKQQKKNQITFKHMNDVLSKEAHNHNISMMNSTHNDNSRNTTKSTTVSTSGNSSTTNNLTSKKERKKSSASNITTPANTALPAQSMSPQPTTPSSPGTTPNNTNATTPKRKPMFILASSYLSNYSSNGSESNTNTNTNPTSPTTLSNPNATS
ncbi:hypothetical protein BDF20DRAFT_866435 [Mycotypha africana]|uniref:uncharacterized protein n=1 Tax=Mycotypha africana TaxID=64632 RepID=UPI00230167DD|nr:uncharacterized protein BDF20DRAFT_866435 [Mycotypha africana]KAI8982346.1 hypothetical protein BDF20DRAFT_866435 [Mycotypha africana]